MVFELFLYGDDSKVLKDDSGSMKTIANLTMIFRPFMGVAVSLFVSVSFQLVLTHSDVL